MPPEPVEGSPHYWLRRARSVLFIAALPMSANDVLPADLCFHAEQAAEKAIKGVCEHFDISPPYTHDIRALLNLLDGRTVIPPTVAAAEALSEYAVGTRYTGPIAAVTAEDLAEAVELATTVVEWAERIIGDDEPNPTSA